MTELLRTESLEVGYARRALLPEVTFAVAAGELWALIGQNGSGKTTLLRTLLGLLPRVGGRIIWGSEAQVGYVPQRSTVDQDIPSRVVDLVGLGVDRGRSFLDPFYLRKHRDDVEQAMRDTNVLELANHRFSALSEGQKQRVLMARALASNPRLLVLDEPTSAMDVVAEESILSLLNTLRDKRDLGVLLVSHHLPIVAAHATHAMLVDKDNALVEHGTMAEIAASPECRARYGNLLADAVGSRGGQS